MVIALMLIILVNNGMIQPVTVVSFKSYSYWVAAKFFLLYRGRNEVQRYDKLYFKSRFRGKKKQTPSPPNPLSPPPYLTQANFSSTHQHESQFLSQVHHTKTMLKIGIWSLYSSPIFSYLSTLQDYP